jgi:hypothetical protein
LSGLSLLTLCALRRPRFPTLPRPTLAEYVRHAERFGAELVYAAVADRYGTDTAVNAGSTGGTLTTDAS